MRSVKKGMVAFGLVNVAVKMYTACEDHDLKGHQVHGKDTGQIRYKRVCEVCGEVVDNADIVKSYSHGDKTAVLTNDDLATLDKERSPNFDVLQFVARDEIDPILFESTYYLGVEKGSESGYALLRQALIDSEMFGVVEFTYRQKTRMGVLRVYEDVLAIHTIRWHDEVRSVAELQGATQAVQVDPKMAEMGRMLVESMSGDWDPTAYADEYTVNLAEMVAARAEGTEYVADEVEDDDGASDVSDLLAKLEASIAVSSAKKQKSRRTDAEIDASMDRHPAGRKRAKVKAS